MQTIKAFLDQSNQIWKDSTGAARLGIILLMLICSGAIVGVGVWSVQPNYVVFRERIPSAKVAHVVSALDQANIRYQWTGSTIYVDQRKLADAAIATEALGITSTDSGFEPTATDMWTDPRARENNDRHNRERQISHSIRAYHSIGQADVVLSLPKHEPFSRKNTQPTASVVLTLKPNSRFSEADASSIANLVASSVPGMTVENVAISDSDGNQYEMDDTFRRLTKQERHRLNEERALSIKAQELLYRTLGVGNAIVKINTTFKFHDARVVDITYDKDNAFKSTELIESKTTKGSRNIASGGAGVASNMGDRPPGGSRPMQETKSETIQTTTEAPRTEREEHISTPTLEHMTVSVLINSKELADENGVVAPELKLRFENIVKNAIGFNEIRDQISVDFFDFVEGADGDEVVATPIPWDQVHKILKNISLGFAGLVAFLLGMMTLKKLTPMMGGSPVAASAGREEQMVQLNDLVKQNPEVFAKIIDAWSSAGHMPGAESESNVEPSRQVA